MSETNTIGGAVVTTTTADCGCIEWRQSLAGHDTAVRHYPCEQHDEEVRPVVWHLNAEVTVDSPLDGQHWDAISTVHASLASAEAALERWLMRNEIDVAAARWGEVRDPDCVCNEPDPDTMLDGAVVNWGISRMEVQA